MAPFGDVADQTARWEDHHIVSNDTVGAVGTAHGLIWGLWLPMGVLLLASGLWTRTHRRRERSETDALKNGSLREGPTMIHGAVETGGGDAITVTISQRRRVVKGKNGHTYTYWDEKRREVSARPFRVLLPDGRGVRVQPDAKVRLRDEIEPPVTVDENNRRRLVRLVHREEVWVSGVLSELDARRDGGAYRAAAQEPLLTRGVAPLLVTTEPPGAYHAERAGSHRGWFKGALIALAVVHSTLLYDVTLQILSGHQVDLAITRVSSWDVWVKPKNQRGHWVRHCAVWGRASAGDAEEEREVSCGFHACADQGFCRTVPTRRALLTADTLRDVGRGPNAHVVQVILTGLVGWITLLCYVIALRSSRPWYAGGKVNDGP